MLRQKQHQRKQSKAMLYTKKAANSWQLSLFSPAKVNLFFRVLYKRTDGFHEIASLYQAISLSDILHISLSDQDVFTCSESSLALDETNLINKALLLFRKKTATTSCFHIHLEKRIPMEAGLGGGSSNAATALWAFCQLLNRPCDEKLLMQWGAELGSDVPFFFSSGTAYVTGRGEAISNIKNSPVLSFWIAKPNWGLSTAAVYASCQPFDFIQRNPAADLNVFLQGERSFYNDLEKPAFSLSPDLEKLKETLLQMGFNSVVLSGSGTAFFCFGPLEEPKLEGVQFFSVRTLQRKDQEWYEL